MKLIGISGKIGSGKDTIGQIINYLTCCNNFWSKGKEIPTNFTLELFSSKYYTGVIGRGDFEIKKFAGTLKDVVCLLINCTREQLENIDFKNKELGEEWRVYQRDYRTPEGNYKSMITKEQYDVLHKLDKYNNTHVSYYNTYILTPRLLLQLFGTECGRQILHPNIWVNTLFSSYVVQKNRVCLDCKDTFNWNGTSVNNPVCTNCGSMNHAGYFEQNVSSWIITDMRFPNEMEAIKSRGGITIQVLRTLSYSDNTISFAEDQSNQMEAFKNKTDVFHPSETALDDAVFDYIIKNDGTIEELVVKVKGILTNEGIING